MDKAIIDLFYGSMLHDVGKMVQRSTKEKRKHAEIGSEFIKKYTDNPTILNQIGYHHYHELKLAKLNSTDLAYITYIADNIASGVDRREHNVEVDRQWDSQTNLEDIFNRFGTTHTKRYFEPRELDLTINQIFAQSEKKAFTKSEYSQIMTRVENTLSVIDFNELYMQSLLNLFEATASYIPSSTNLKEVVDISLYDHLKMTTAFASSIYYYTKSKGETDYAQILFKEAQAFYDVEAFRLVSFDLSGIQSFIYTITDSGAHKQLRSRSFYLDMISEYLADYLLKEIGLTRANMMYSGGGHAYLILPNTEEAVQQVEKVEATFNAFFLKHFSTEIYVAFGTAPFAAKQIMSGNTLEMYRKIFKTVSKEISQKKMTRYSPNALIELNLGGKKSGRECKVCHSVDYLLKEEAKCKLCSKLEAFSRNIQRDDYFEVNTDRSGLPIGPDAYLHRINKSEILKAKETGLIYAKNQFNTGLNQATHLWVADYTFVENNQFSEYVDREWTKIDNEKEGVKRLAVLRCDVDDLGYAFMAGFSHQDKGRYNTFTRTAAFSRHMSLFFKLYINTFAEDLRLTVVYAGGDDVFLLGAWDDVIVFSVELRQHFKRFTNDKLSLSTGIGLFHDKTPINLMASITGELESSAKDNGKDSICLFNTESVFKYDTFINDVYYGKLSVIRAFFNEQNERGKAFIYKLLELIRDRDEKDRIAFARLAYYLSRLEELAKNKEHFNAFKQSMRDWFEDSEEIRQAEMAFTLYVYETRKEG